MLYLLLCFDPGRRGLTKTLEFAYPVSSVSVHPGYNRLVSGSSTDPWVRIHKYQSGEQLGGNTSLLLADL